METMQPVSRYRLYLDRVRDLSALVHGLSDPEDVFSYTLQAMAELTTAKHAFITLVDEAAGVIRGHRGLGLPTDVLPDIVQPLTSKPSPTEGVHSYVVRTRSLTLTELGDPRLNGAILARYPATKYGVTVPLIGRCGVLGTLSAGWNHEEHTDPELLATLTIFADHVAAAIESQRLLAAERRQRLVGEELHGVAQQITAGLSLDDALAAVLRAVERLLGAASSSIWLIDQPDRMPVRRFTTRYTGQPHWDHTPYTLAVDGPLAELLHMRRPYVLDDIQTDREYRQFAEEDTRTLAAVPVSHGERLIGVLYANWRERRSCEADDLRLLATLAAYGAIAVENARLHAREVEAARLDGVLLAARTAAHEINNELAVTMGMAEIILMRAKTGGHVDLSLLESIVESAERSAQRVHQLQRVVRLEERRYHDLPPILDLERSSEKTNGV